MGDQKIVLYSIIFALVWQAIGYYMVMYMASMAAVSYTHLDVYKRQWRKWGFARIWG